MNFFFQALKLVLEFTNVIISQSMLIFFESILIVKVIYTVHFMAPAWVFSYQLRLIS